MPSLGPDRDKQLAWHLAAVRPFEATQLLLNFGPALFTLGIGQFGYTLAIYVVLQITDDFRAGRKTTLKSVNYVVTIPGPRGQWVAFLAEVVISFGLMMMVLVVTNTRHLARYTGLFAGALVALYISVEAPLSGMSMNPARTFGSALPANLWTGLWIYFIGPPLAMLLAAELYLRIKTVDQVICAKLHHINNKRCIFRNCGYKKNERRD